MNLGNKILKLRKDNKMSQEDFAEALNVTRQTVSNWENLKNYPDIETLILISDKFNISLDILLKGDREMIKSIDKKIKDYSKWKKSLLAILIVIIIGICLVFMFYDKINDYFSLNFDITNKPGYIVMCEYKDEVIQYQLSYRNFENYSYNDLSGSYSTGLSNEIRSVTKKINELRKTEKTFKNVYEHIQYIKSLYEDVGATCEIIKYDNLDDYIEKSDEAQNKYYDIIENKK